jgi:hypothetical protein
LSPKSFIFQSHIKKQKQKNKLYKTVILLFVLYGCETWSLTLRAVHRLRVFENRVLRIFGLKMENGSWRKLRNNELHGLYSSPNIIRVIKSKGMRWAGHVPHMGGGERCLQGFGLEAQMGETTRKTYV